MPLAKKPYLPLEHADTCSECDELDDRRAMIRTDAFTYVHSHCIMKWLRYDDAPLFNLPHEEIRKLRICDISHSATRRLLDLLDHKELQNANASR